MITSGAVVESVTAELSLLDDVLAVEDGTYSEAVVSTGEVSLPVSVLDVLVDVVEQDDPYPARHVEDSELDADVEVVSTGAVSLAIEEVLDTMSVLVPAL